MAIPGHKSNCQRRGWWTTCRYCGQEVFYLECTCGSKVFFDDTGGDWPKHIDSCPVLNGEITQTSQNVFTKDQLNDFTRQILEVKGKIEALRKQLHSIEIIEVKAQSNSVSDTIVDGVISEIRKVNLFHKVNLPDNQFTRAILGEFNIQPMCEVIIESSEMYEERYYKQWYCLMSLSDVNQYKLRANRKINAEVHAINIYGDLYYWIIDDFD